MQPWCRRPPALLLSHLAWLFNSDCMLLRPVSVSLSLPRSHLVSAGNGHFHVPPSPRSLEQMEQHGRSFFLPQLLHWGWVRNFLFCLPLSSSMSSSCAVPGCWARGGCTAVAQVCSGQQQWESPGSSRVISALASTWLVALPFLSYLALSCPSWLLLPRECCHHRTAAGVAALLTIA